MALSSLVALLARTQYCNLLKGFCCARSAHRRRSSLWRRELHRAADARARGPQREDRPVGAHLPAQRDREAGVVPLDPRDAAAGPPPLADLVGAVDAVVPRAGDRAVAREAQPREHVLVATVVLGRGAAVRAVRRPLNGRGERLRRRLQLLRELLHQLLGLRQLALEVDAL